MVEAVQRLSAPELGDGGHDGGVGTELRRGVRGVSRLQAHHLRGRERRWPVQETRDVESPDVLS